MSDDVAEAGGRDEVAFLLAMWEDGIRREIEELLDPLPHLVWLHVSLFMVCLRNVERAARMGLEHEPELVQAALDRFQERMPRAIRARNVLEHFDEYTDLPMHALIDDDRSTITIREGDEPIRINLREARTAASELVDAVIDAVQP